MDLASNFSDWLGGELIERKAKSIFEGMVLVEISRPFGTGSLIGEIPALKRPAIVGHPFGIKREILRGENFGANALLGCFRG